VSALAQDWAAPVIYVTARIDRAHNVAEQLPVWMGASAMIDRFAEPTPFFYERAPWTETSIRRRIETLVTLAAPDVTPWPLVVVTSARAVMQRTLSPALFGERIYTLHPAQRHTIEHLAAQWIALGYEHTPVVVAPGQFTRRGGILDIFPMASSLPVRIEFFDDEIESLRSFDPATQRSLQRLDTISIPPAREALPGLAPKLGERLQPWFATLNSTGNAQTSAQEDAAGLQGGTAFPYLEHYMPFLYEQPYTLLDYAPDNALFILEDEDELRAAIQDIENRATKTREEMLAQKSIAPDHPPPHVGWEYLETGFAQRLTVSLGMGQEAEDGLSFRGLLAPEARFAGQLKTLLSQCRADTMKGDRIVAVSAQTPRIVELWRETETKPVTQAEKISEAPPARTVTFVEGTLQEGWRLRIDSGELHLYTDAEIFGWARPEPRRRPTAHRARTPELSYTDLKEGDFVVHLDYGVGRFSGLRRRTLEGMEREYIEVEYAGTDTLFVPIHQADRLTRYVGSDDKPPSIQKLGQADWNRIKSKARQAVEKEAQELLVLYARRASTPGHAFSHDRPWQHELEAMFPFVETEDQLRAVQAVKEDMERPHPMDRLICGDVGYGKTEVAVRAAFKSVMDGKQVAVLVPTTILAQQHYETFRRRMAAFPVTVEALSRFRTRQEQSALVRRLAQGDIDIVIGTHRLLQEDVKFKHLGLLIIDEEQRFGVRHKEHLKSLRTEVDILTLTATPIPRTLFMGLAGVRDISMIETPPEERLPVITHVGSFDEQLIRQAVLRELERGGQVFIVHNRVQTIHALRDRLERIVPEARMGIAHGQMDERLLEGVMTAFGNGEHDILLATSIIESGLDIPNANTLIVDRADWFGMAQLYQLRGRVGRSAQQAYAYFFHPAASRLTEEARTRLQTLAEYTALGSGYQIAMRDLELRGAGDILSMRQTGHIAAIGLHLYAQMLAQAVRQLKGERPDPTMRTISENALLMDLPIPAYLPTDWMPDMGLRLQIYRRIGGLDSLPAVDSMRTELRDRFGVLPSAVNGLLYQIEVKLLGRAANASAIVKRSGHIDVRLPYLVQSNRDYLQRRLGQGAHVTRTSVELPMTDDWQTRLVSLLTRLAELVHMGIST
jgi:transcription-repair coupling factor (superfamily II helicase)